MLLSIPGRLFGPEQPAAGSAVFAAMDDIGLRITTEDGRHLAPTNSQLQLRYAGFDGKHWQLSWSEGDRHWALLFDDAAAIAAIEHEPPAGLREAVAGLLANKRRSSMRRGLGLSAIGLWLALPLLLLVALLVAARPLSGWLAGFVPLQQEVKLGDWFFDQQRAGLDLITDTPANAALEAIGARLSEGSAYPFRWHVVRDPTLNAFAIPGGIVVVHSGLMLAADGADELAGVIAHEIEHVEQRHSLRAMLREAGLRLAVAAVIGDFGIAGSAAGQLSSLSFSRDSEREADELGLQRLARAGIDPDGMLRLFAKLDAESKGQAPPAWLASHPTTPERIARLRERIGQLPSTPRRPLVIDWPAVQSSLGS